jgi:hypothetical protein
MRSYYYGTVTMRELLTENKHLKQAITNLTSEEQIGYAKVISQQIKDGKLFTTIRFVETSRDDNLKKILERDYTIEGDIVYFDALVVKFSDKMVMDGKQKSLYLWRRVYGEKMAPEAGLSMEEAGVEPRRYKDILRMLPAKQRDVFWSGIWELANDPDRLAEYGVRAIYGNVLYSKLREGFVYVFKITPGGQLYPGVQPEM